MHARTLAWLAVAFLLGGCATQAQLDVQAHERCISWGAKARTAEYISCRTAEEANQIQRQQGLGSLLGAAGQGIGALFALGIL